MAGVLRLGVLRTLIGNQSRNGFRAISTSQKNKDSVAVSASKTKDCAEPEIDFTDTTKHWVSYGFDHKNKSTDRVTTNMSMFLSITMCLVVGTFIWSYLPDPMLRDWAQREAYLVLRQREAAGLEPISRDYIDPSTITLPSDEELGQTEIII